MKLDLHGISHYEVSNLIDQFIWESMNMNQYDVEIVTGNSDKMKKVVIEVINEYKLQYQIGDGWNTGYIRIFLK